MRVPLVRVGEVGRVGSADAGSSEKGVRSRNDILGTRDGHGRLDSAHDGVDRSVKTEGFLYDSLVKGQLGEVFVSQRRQIGTEVLDLLLVELFHDVRVLSETEHNPRAGGRRRVLASHEEGNHHVGDLVVRDRGTVLVSRVHQVLHHVVLRLVVTLSTAFLDGVHVDLGNSALGVVALAVRGERSPVKLEVDGGEAHIEVMVEIGQGLVKLVANGAALEGVGGSKDSDLGHPLGDVDNAGLALELGASLEVIADLGGDDGNVRAEGFGGESNLHELGVSLLASSSSDLVFAISHLLLFHELGVGAVVDDILSKDRSGEDAVDLLSRDVLELSVKDEIVSGRAKSDSGFLSEEDKGEDIAVLVLS